MSRKVPRSHDPEYILDVIEHVGRLAVESKCAVFGFAHDPKPERRFGLSVVGLRAWVRGCAQGVVDPDMRFDEGLSGKEDFDICVQSLEKSRLCWQDRRWTFVAKAWDLHGGMRTIRTHEKDQRDLLYLQIKWGRTVIKAGGTPKQNKRGQRLQIGVP